MTWSGKQRAEKKSQKSAVNKKNDDRKHKEASFNQNLTQNHQESAQNKKNDDKKHKEASSNRTLTQNRSVEIVGSHNQTLTGNR